MSASRIVRRAREIAARALATIDQTAIEADQAPLLIRALADDLEIEAERLKAAARELRNMLS